VAGKEIATFAMAGSATILIAAAVPPALVYLWMERSNAMDLIGKAFVPPAKPSEAQA
jgi:hypothetical protein